MNLSSPSMVLLFQSRCLETLRTGLRLPSEELLGTPRRLVRRQIFAAAFLD